MDILKEVMKYIRYWYVFLFTISLSLIAAFFFIQSSIPSYKISSTLLIKESTGTNNRVKESAFSDLDMFHSFSTVQNEIEVLRSRDLLYKVLKSLSLETSYAVKGLFSKKELYGQSLPVIVTTHQIAHSAYSKKELSIELIDSNSFYLIDSTDRKSFRFGQIIQHPEYTISVMKGPSFSLPHKPIMIEFKDLNSMAEAYSLGGLVVFPVVKDANTIVLNLEDAVPQRGVDILSKLIETYNLDNVQNKGMIARSTINFIDNRLKYLSEDLTGVEQDVESYKRQNMVTNLNSDAQVSVQNSGNYSQQLGSIEVQIAVIRSIEKYLKQSDNKAGLVPSVLTLQDQTLTALTGKYNDLQIEKQRLLRTVRPNNPLVIGINEQLAGLKTNLSEALANVKKGLSLERNSLMARTSKYTEEIKRMPAIERGLLERSRAQSVKEGLFHYLLQKREETALSLSSTVPNSEVIDKPAFNSNPVSPKTSLIYLASFLAGCILPVCVIYCKDLLSSKVQDISEVKSIEGIRILGELCHRKKQEDLIMQQDSRTTMSELFRYIRMNLNFINIDNQNKVLLITSSMMGEGKTFFSINLGMSMAFINKKVVLLEFDLRKPDLLDYIGLTKDIGLSDYLTSDRHSLDDILVQSAQSPNLYVIGCGTNPENPSELLMSYKISELIRELRERFDYVIVDTSPVGQVADAFSLATYTDASIYLVRYNFTNTYQLEILRDIVSNNKLKNVQVVFNDAKLENGNAYGYGRYGYAANKKRRKELAG